MAKKEVYHSGHDIKSLLINLATFLFFLLPFGLYYFQDYQKEQYIIVGLGFLIAFLAPPIGCLRPHPYSDDPSNKPLAPNMKFSATAIKQS